jgi:DNA-binding NarL/FixJ family response regulator
VRVVIADDATLLREGLSRLLAELGIETAAQVGNGDDLILAVEQHLPDVAIVDIRMPPTWTDEGIVAAAQVRKQHPGVGVLLLSQHLDVSAALALDGARPGGFGYLLKERIADAVELSDALTRVAAGQTVLDPEVVRELMQRGRAGYDWRGSLTGREREVLALMAEGRSNAAIARALTVTPRTVESHVAAIFDKLTLPLGPDDHRRVLAVRSWLAASSADPGKRSP